VNEFFQCSPLPWEFSVIKKFAWNWIDEFAGYDENRFNRILNLASIIHKEISPKLWTREVIVRDRSEAVHSGDLLNLVDQLKGFYAGQILRLANELTKAKYRDVLIGETSVELKKIIKSAETQRLNFREMRDLILMWFSQLPHVRFDGPGVKGQRSLHDFTGSGD